MLLAILTLTPSLLRLFGRWAVWPRSLAATDSSAPRLCGWAARMLSRVDLFGGLWEKVGQIVERRPATVWLATVAALAPLAAFCARHYNDVNYGLIQELSKRELSVRGTLALARHYPEGASGPLTVLLRNDHVDFSQSDGLDLVGDLVGRLKAERSALHIADLRSVVDPLGITPAGQAALPQGVTAVLERPLVLGRAIQHYVSDTQVVGRHVTRLDMILDLDPFTRRSIHHLDKLESAIHNALPTADRRDTEIRIIGATASFRDLEVVGQRDRTRISLYVTGSVLLVLVLLLRRLAIPIYLILSVLFGYFVTLGATHAFFRLLEGSSFVGLDWTVPIFLFTLLIAIGEDYNIILVTRVDEEQAHHGPVGGVTAALARTGGTISGCGVIMAGTFASLAFGGALARMYQLGFALTFGVLLDTFVIRPILVPAYLVFVNSGRLGALGRYLGGKTAIPRSPTVGAMP
jgi:RND superfamily putative drug exporter